MIYIKLLLIENDNEISDMLSNFLKTENFDVITALYDNEACNKFSTNTFVQGNTEALNRILFNLISNAIRYGSDEFY